jgi:hypothetical protein
MVVPLPRLPDLAISIPVGAGGRYGSQASTTVIPFGDCHCIQSRYPGRSGIQEKTLWLCVAAGQQRTHGPALPDLDGPGWLTGPGRGCHGPATASSGETVGQATCQELARMPEGALKGAAGHSGGTRSALDGFRKETAVRRHVRAARRRGRRTGQSMRQPRSAGRSSSREAAWELSCAA